MADVLQRSVPTQRSEDDIIALLRMHVPDGVVSDAQDNAIRDRIDWRVAKRGQRSFEQTRLPPSCMAWHYMIKVAALSPLLPAQMNAVILIRASMASGKTQKVWRTLC